ncbi:hypothetical protein PFISCL1PPCAC_8076, partial [Pristionchus fissidentatus]
LTCEWSLLGMATAKNYDNASDEINSRILTLILHAEKILSDLPENGDAVRVRNEEERSSRSLTATEESTRQSKKNCCKCKKSKAAPSASLMSHKTTNKAQSWQIADNARGVVVDVSVKVPHRSQPIQLSLDCPKDENARVLIGEKWHPLEEKRRK